MQRGVTDGAKVRVVTTLVWARGRRLREDVAEVPEKWLDWFAATHPADIRKFGDAKNSTKMYRVAAVLEAIEEGAAIGDWGGGCATA